MVLEDEYEKNDENTKDTNLANLINDDSSVEVKHELQENEKMETKHTETEEIDDTDESNLSSEIISENPNKSVYDISNKTLSGDLLEGGTTVVYNIDYIIPDDEKLINSDNVIKKVDKYIANYNSPEMTKYKQTYKQIYQKYSNKKYTIMITKVNNIKNFESKIVVYKNTGKTTGKTNTDIVIELIKPYYLYYNKNCNLSILKREISNARTELLYKYENLTSKLEITPEVKKEFEKERLKFIELLETYYTYTLYHKKINNIITTNKSNLVIQEPIQFYKENSDEDNVVLSGNLYTVDKSTIDIMNKLNSDKLTQYNTLMMNLAGKDTKDILKNKKIIEEIKLYIDRNEIKTIFDSNKKSFEQQSKYIDYIILDLPITAK